jgi:lipoate-protein ligase A
MDYDIKLARECGNNTAYLRFYRWQPYCISLGANQKVEELNIDKLNEDKLEYVKRPTGGRAILHADELTYSVIIPTSCGLGSKEIYKNISEGLVRGLLLYNDGLRGVELEKEQPDFAELLNNPSGSLCFASTAKSEVKYKGKKLIGSAQRKLNNAILQHGSILCGKFHTKLPEYLNLPDSEKSLLLDELNKKTTEIETIINTQTDYSILQNCLIEGIIAEMNLVFENEIMTQEK